MPSRRAVDNSRSATNNIFKLNFYADLNYAADSGTQMFGFHPEGVHFPRALSGLVAFKSGKFADKKSGGKNLWTSGKT
jgi:hypothetical protein